ncbi:diaminobutyrate acetyltransferase [Nocardia jiangsuensis]|uniref:L-2,4-diaminobutyric acid acetyltransferase n=1 Tax=Nocardia jiangsuensis TaxID=1691563 RepID=A0ABV8DP14_9NOCA
MSTPTLSPPTARGTERGGTVLRSPRVGDAAQIWRIAKDSQVLDANPSYAYLLWCRDFPATSVVAEVDGEVVGFVIGFVRPKAPDTVFVWQVAVDPSQRGRGTGTALLHKLLDDTAAAGVSILETTVSPDNEASIAMFGSVARKRGADMLKRPLFDPSAFPDDHEAEDLYTIAPITPEEHR